jgi:hypothetical protein
MQGADFIDPSLAVLYPKFFLGFAVYLTVLNKH